MELNCATYTKKRKKREQNGSKVFSWICLIKHDHEQSNACISRSRWKVFPKLTAELIRCITKTSKSKDGLPPLDDVSYPQLYTSMNRSKKVELLFCQDPTTPQDAVGQVWMVHSLNFKANTCQFVWII